MNATWRIIEGDALDRLRELPAESVQTCVTSPPYFGLRDYGHEGQIGLEGTPDEFVAALVAVFREVRRVLRDDGTVWLNLGDSYATTSGGGQQVPQTNTGAGYYREFLLARPTTVGWEPACDHTSEGRAVVLDPFAGAGTTGLVALRLDRSFVGIELNPTYAAMARRRIHDDAPLLNGAAEQAA